MKDLIQVSEVVNRLDGAIISAKEAVGNLLLPAVTAAQAFGDRMMELAARHPMAGEFAQAFNNFFDGGDGGVDWKKTAIKAGIIIVSGFGLAGLVGGFLSLSEAFTVANRYERELREKKEAEK